MLLVYGDESMDETQERVCAAGAVVGNVEQWAALEARWTERTGRVPFHANDCESSRGLYKYTPHGENLALYRDLTTMLAESGLCGFGSAIDLKAQRSVFPEMPDHWSYFRVLVDVIEFMKNCATDVDDRAEITFDNRVESEFNTTLVYANLRKEYPEWNERLSSKILFDSSISNPRIQVGDLFAREVMKDLDNLIGPVKRKTRAAWKALRDTRRFVAYNYGADWFRDLAPNLSNLAKQAGFSRRDYEVWLQKRRRQHNLTAYIEFFHWHKTQNHS